MKRKNGRFAAWFAVLALLILSFHWFGVGLFMVALFMASRIGKRKPRPSSSFKSHFAGIPKNEQEQFRGWLNEEDATLFDEYMETHNQHQEQLLFQQMLHNQFIEEFNMWAMEEGIKSVTPFDEGGYLLGEGFNPSDTMAAESNRLMDEMTHNDAHHFDDHMGGGMDF